MESRKALWRVNRRRNKDIITNIINHSKAIKIVFRKTDVLTIDAISITGILILLTISGSSKQPVIAGLESILFPYVKTVVSFTIIPFSLSAISEISAALSSNNSEQNATPKGMKLMRSGFWLLVAIGIMVGLLQFADFFGASLNLTPLK